ncbi:unnamed protein product, partial [Closterium sp. NIES-53]
MADHLSPPWSHVCHVLQSLEQRRANCVVTVDDDSGATLTGSQLVADVACLARGLETFCGVAPGERVCIAALNSSAYVQWLLAVPAVGAILAPLNHRWSIGEAAAAVQQVGATVLAVDAHMLPWWAHLKPLCPSLRLGVLISDQPIPSSASSP